MNGATAGAPHVHTLVFLFHEGVAVTFVGFSFLDEARNECRTRAKF
jgi:hypothetical protein